MKFLPDRPVKLSIYSSPACLPVVRAALEKMCELIGFDSETAGAVVLSADEGLTNIIKHAYDGAADQPIDVELTPFGAPAASGLRIRLRDFGRVVDPSQIKSRDLRDVRPGGLGVHIMNECMDRIEYRPAEGGGTLLTMVKNLPAEKGGKT